MAALFRGDLIELIIVVGIMIIIGVGKALAKKSADQKEANNTRHKNAIRPTSKAKKTMASSLDDFMAQISSGPVNKPEPEPKPKTVIPAPPPVARRTQPTPAAEQVRVLPAVGLRTPRPARHKKQMAAAIPVAAQVATPASAPARTASTPKRKRRRKSIRSTKPASPPQAQKTVELGFFSNLDTHQLARAVVMAEVLGKPRGMSPYSGPPDCG
jgi:cytoskeletal protein RodZ